MSYVPQIAWSFWVRDVVMLNATDYQVTIERDNVNDPGSSNENCAVGYYIKDYIGHVYKVKQILSTSPLTIVVEDILQVNIGPQEDRLGYVYRSVGNGDAPIIAPIEYRRLDESAEDYSRAIELEVIWQKKVNEELALAYSIAL